VWVNGDVLTAPDLDAEFDNIINNATALVSPLTTSLDFGSNQAVAMRLENRTSNPSPTVDSTGRIFIYTPEGLVAMHDGVRAGVLVGPSEALSRVSGLQGSLISNIGSFQANEYQLRRGGSQQLAIAMTATSSFSVNTQTAGPIANGRDQAAAFASTDVHFYAISTGTFSTAIAGVCSSNAPPTGPTLPSNYTYWAYLCSAKYATASSAIPIDHVLHGATLRFSGQALINVNTTTVSITSAAIQPKLYIPSAAVAMLLRPRITGGYSAGGALDIEINIYPSSSGPITEYFRPIAQGPASAGQSNSWPAPAFKLPVIQSTPMLYYDLNVNTGVSVGLTVDAVGYTVANGDVS